MARGSYADFEDITFSIGVGPVGQIRKVFADDEDKATCSVMRRTRIPPNPSIRDKGCEEGVDYYEQGFVLKDFYKQSNVAKGSRLAIFKDDRDCEFVFKDVICRRKKKMNMVGFWIFKDYGSVSVGRPSSNSVSVLKSGSFLCLRRETFPIRFPLGDQVPFRYLY